MSLAEEGVQISEVRLAVHSGLRRGVVCEHEVRAEEIENVADHFESVHDSSNENRDKEDPDPAGAVHDISVGRHRHRAADDVPEHPQVHKEREQTGFQDVLGRKVLSEIVAFVVERVHHIKNHAGHDRSAHRSPSCLYEDVLRREHHGEWADNRARDHHQYEKYKANEEVLLCL
eukprot:CAMPEP_0168343456 /NCGR_PEP_ID=MMETSP0213-20121227/16104_1 /TAXON_ID=151035 /ORGANISM="Euplotes harpa, Strain FSP1.4" /LENGTH=173 /DNA_ID=CAMNT_0008350755 /DNA_START=539 /DNA_END=1061 /DNA_ORIENTATION=-